ncbi:hypothetical protein HYX02_03805 [Candidatus Woesearchaeota archaeon]|nr:hypothetical protein [Candidatus Woesearchaeota archaeon]
MPADNVLRTVADELVELVNISKKISVEEAAKKLKMSVDSVQALIDFLVEEKVFGLEYKFTTPYVYIYKEGVQETERKEKSFTEGLITKEQFYEKAKERNVPHEHIEGLWRRYLQQNLVQIRAEFLRKAKERNLPGEKIEDIWNKYISYL